MARHHPNGDVRFRARGIICLAEGRFTPAEIAGVLGINDQTVYNWKKAWQERGLVGLMGGHQGGAPAIWSSELIDTAVEIAKAKPLTLEKIKQGVLDLHPDAPDISTDRLAAWLKKCDLTCKRCRLFLEKERGEEYELKKRELGLFMVAAVLGLIRLLFLDESGFSNVPNVQYGWSPKGIPHRADASVPKKRVNVIAALNWAATDPEEMLPYVLHETNVKRTDVVAFIDSLTTLFTDGIPTIVVRDNASIHCNIEQEKLHEWACDHQLILYELPVYSPELNPIEIVWKQAKYYWREFVTWSKENMVDEIRNLFQGYGTKFKINFS